MRFTARLFKATFVLATMLTQWSCSHRMVVIDNSWQVKFNAFKQSKAAGAVAGNAANPAGIKSDAVAAEPKPPVIRWTNTHEPWKISPAVQHDDADLYKAIAAYTTGRLRNKYQEEAGSYLITTGNDKWGLPHIYALKHGPKSNGHSDTLLILSRMDGPTLMLAEDVIRANKDLPLDKLLAIVNTMEGVRKGFGRAEEGFTKVTANGTCVIKHGLVYFRAGGDCNDACDFVMLDNVAYIPWGATKWTAGCEGNNALKDNLWTMHVNWAGIKMKRTHAGNLSIISSNEHTNEAFVVDESDNITSKTVVIGKDSDGTTVTAVAKHDTVSFFSRKCKCQVNVTIRQPQSGKYIVTIGKPDTTEDSTEKQDEGTPKQNSVALMDNTGQTNTTGMSIGSSPNSSNATTPALQNTGNNIAIGKQGNNQAAASPDVNSVKLIITSPPAATAADNNTWTPVQPYNIDGVVDQANITNWLLGGVHDDACASALALMINDKIKAFEIKAVRDSGVNAILRITDSLAEFFDGDAGQFVLNKHHIPVYDGGLNPIRGEYLEPVGITVRTDYNRIHSVVITGNLHLPNGDIEKMAVTNNYVSLTMWQLNNAYLRPDGKKNPYQGYVLSLNNRRNEFICANDALLFIPKRERWHFMLKNQDLYLDAANGWKATASKRSLNDYLSLRIYLDPFGFLSSTPNGLLQAEGHATLPMNIRKGMGFYGFGRNVTMFPESEATFSTVYAASANVASRLITPDTFRTNDSPHNYRNYVNNFDFFRKYNVQFNFRQSVLAFELKRFNLWLHVELGFDAYGANGQLYLDTASTSGTPSVPVSSYLTMWYPVAGLKAELRPDAKFGLSASIEFYPVPDKFYLGNNVYNSRLNADFTYGSDFMTRHELNFYALIGNNSSGGLFFKYTGHIAHYYGKESIGFGQPPLDSKKTWAFFPQILIGYSTNISAFIKDVNKRY